MGIEVLRGRTIVGIVGGEDSDRIKFELDGDESYIMEHCQDCCESVSINDIYGDLRGLIGHVVADASEFVGDLPDEFEFGTLTRFIIRSDNQLVMITWHGYSNGYYSEGVSFYKEGGSRW